MAMEIFKLIGSVMVDSDQAEKSLQKTDDKASNVGKTLASGVATAAKWGAAMVTGTVAVAGAAVKLASGAASTADTIDKASQRMNISAESYQELAHASSLCGVEMSTLEKAAKKLEGTDLNMDQALEQIYALETAEERSAKAAELFGDSVAYSMSPMLKASAEDIAAMRQEANDLNLVMSNDTVASGVALNDSISKVKDSITALATNLGASLMPIIQTVCDMIIEFMPTIQKTVQKLAPVITSLLEAIIPILSQAASSIVPLLVTTIGSVLPLLESLVQSILPPVLSVIQMLVPPLLQIIQTVLPLVVSLLNILIPPILQIVEMLLPILLDTIMALLPCLEPILGLLQPILDLLMVLIEPLLQLIGAILPPVATLITKVATILAGVLKKALVAIKPLFDALGTAIGWVADQISPLVDKAGEKFTQLKEKMTGPLTTAKDKIKEIVDKIKGFFTGMKLSFPSIKLPHFKIKPDGWEIGDLLKGVKPTLGIDWYARGGILDHATPLNMAVGGEAGKEAVIPLEKNTKGIELIAGKLSENMANPSQAVVDKLDELLSAINGIKEMGITLDSGALVGGIAKPMDRALGQMAVSKARYV